MRVQCPECGWEGDIETDAMTSLSLPGVSRNQVWDTVEVVEPMRTVSVVADVLVPLLQALVPAGVGAIVLGVAGAPVQIVLGGAGVLLGTVWAMMLHRQASGSCRVHTYRREAPPAGSVEVWVSNAGVGNDGKVPVGAEVKRSMLPDRRRLRVVFGEVLSGRRRWSGRSLHRCDGMSQAEASQLVDDLVKAGLLAWRDGQPRDPAGAVLTEAGNAFAEHLLK